MPELFQVVTPAVAWERLREHLSPHPRSRETVSTSAALGRVLAVEVLAPHDLPQFPRSTMDGFAVRAADTHGASASLPAYLEVGGEVAMGQHSSLEVARGTAVVVHTGGMVPASADAVVMVEHTQLVAALTAVPPSGVNPPAGPERVAAGALEIFRPVAAGENVIQIGEDVRRGQALLPAGHRLRPQDLGALMALGLTRVEVASRPRVAILSQGDEVIPPEQEPRPGQVRDINSTTLAALTVELGGEPLRDWGILPDRRDLLEQAARQALAVADVVVFSAGSSVSVLDLTAAVVAGLGEPGILAHGLSIKPGKPTVVAVCNGRAVFGLPGNPVSAIVVFRLLVAPVLRLLLGTAPPTPRTTRARLSRNLASQAGREDHVPVQLEQRDGEAWAVPVLGKSNLICTLVRAVGLVHVPLDQNGLGEGELVEVELF